MPYDPKIDYGALLKEKLGDAFEITPTGFRLGAPIKATPRNDDPNGDYAGELAFLHAEMNGEL